VSPQIDDFDSCKSRVLGNGAQTPSYVELKDFWRFYKSQAKGIIGNRPTVKTLLSKAKQFNAGFARCTKKMVPDDTVAEINWVQKRTYLFAIPRLTFC